MAKLGTLVYAFGFLLNPCFSQPLELVYHDPINVDMTNSTASTVLQLRNPAKKNPECVLSIGDFVSKNTGKRLGSSATFYKDDKPVGPTVKLTNRSERFTVKVDFEHLVEAGESDAALKCNQLGYPLDSGNPKM